MVEGVFQTFSTIIGHMITIENFEEGEILIYVMLPIHFLKIWKNLSSMAYISTF